MRIAYVALHLEEKIISGGVGNKILSQMRLWRSFGHTAHLYLLTPDDIQPHEQAGDISCFVFQPTGQLPLLKFASREISRSSRLLQLIQAVARFQPDVIYLRYGLYTYPLQTLFEIAPVVLEINTNDLDEYRMRGRFFFSMNRWTRGILLSRAGGLAQVSHEIARLPANQKYNKPMCVLANGIELSRYTPLPAPNNHRPVLVFVGTHGYSWHGVDKLFDLARVCPDLQIEVIGYRTTDFTMPAPANLQLHGFLDQEQIRTILEKADVSCGTLALHRKSMEEASPLKVREALAYGLPVILAYQDTDFLDARVDFLLQIPNTEENVYENATAIRAFAYAMQGHRVDRDFIQPRIDQSIKEQARLDFFFKLTGAP